MAATYLTIDIDTNKIIKTKTIDTNLGCTHITRRKLRFVVKNSNGRVIDLCKSCLTDLIDIIDREILEK
jgi:hypothetical protein